MSLSTLETRILEVLPEKHHKDVVREFSKYKTEVNRVSDNEENFGQATLTTRERSEAVTTNQHGDYGHTIIELQCLKAIAMKYNINDWISYIDAELTYEENKKILEKHGNPSNKKLYKKENMKSR